MHDESISNTKQSYFKINVPYGLNPILPNIDNFTKVKPSKNVVQRTIYFPIVKLIIDAPNIHPNGMGSLKISTQLPKRLKFFHIFQIQSHRVKSKYKELLEINIPIIKSEISKKMQISISTLKNVKFFYIFQVKSKLMTLDTECKESSEIHIPAIKSEIAKMMQTYIPTPKNAKFFHIKYKELSIPTIKQKFQKRCQTNLHSFKRSRIYD